MQSKIIYKRKTTAFRKLFIAMMIFAMATVGVFADREADIKNGQTIHWHHDAELDGVDKYTVDGTDLVGFCAEVGVRTNDSGTAKVNMLSNSSTVTKVLYYIHQHGWDTPSKLDSRQAGPLPNGWYYRTVCQTMVQYAAQGNAAVEYWRSYGTSEWSDTNIAYVTNLVDQIARGSAAPSNCAAFKASQNGQDFAVFFVPINGYLTLKKTADRTGYNTTHSIAGAVYYVYTNSSCTTRAKDINGNYISLTTNANGDTSVVEVSNGTYYAKEVTPPDGYSADPNVRSITVTSSNTQSNPARFQSQDTLKTGYVAMKKVSGNTDITG